MVCITLLLIGDYFHETHVASYIPKWLLIIVIVLLFTKSKNWNRRENPTVYKWQLFFILYTILLIGVLTLLGGTSKVGIAFDNPFFWGIMGIAILEMIYSVRKRKGEEE